MPAVTMRELLEAGVHFGHQTRRWNPKMRRFIFTERSGIYIIDLQKTIRLVEDAHEFAKKIGARNGNVLFVGTKKQAREAVAEQAGGAGQPYVNHRWLGGLLTNFQTISQRIKRLHDLERYQTEGQLQLLPTREACSATASWLCFFVPTNRTVPPRPAMLRAKACASSSSASVCWRSMM